MPKLSIDKQLTGGFTWLLLGNVLYSACQWAIIVVLAHLGSADQVGEYALGMAICAPVVLFANLQLRALVASDVASEFSLSQYLTFRLVSLAVVLLLIAAVAVGSQSGWHRGGVICLVGCAQCLEYVGQTYYGAMQRHGRLDRIATSLLLKGPLALAWLWAAMYFTHSVAWAVTGLAFGRLAILLGWDARLGFIKTPEAVRLAWDSRKMLRLFRIALPLGIISMLASLNASIPQYFVQAHLGSADLGIFSAIASLVNAGTLVIGALGQAIFLPVAQACVAADLLRFRGFIVQAVTVGAALGGAAVALSLSFGRQILAHVFRPEYGDHAGLMVWLTGAATVMFVASGLGYIMTAARSFNPQIPLLLATSFAAAVVAAWSIPRHGLRGAAESWLAAALVQLAGTLWILWGIDRQIRLKAESLQIRETELAGLSTGDAKA
jgi:O-antigen/teichoic acid export membrane protein